MASERPLVAVLDYGSGNVHSAVKALEKAGADVRLTRDRALVAEADGLLVPGVGAFSAVMQQLESIRGSELIERRLAGGRPVMGICVGMQILFDEGDEHGVHTRGAGEWPGAVERLHADILPHMGWNTVERAADSQMFAQLSEEERFYFVHSYGVRDWTLETDDLTTPPSVAWAQHENDRFVAAVENGPLWATQFHPEKSGDAGLQLLSNWVDTL